MAKPATITIIALSAGLAVVTSIALVYPLFVFERPEPTMHEVATITSVETNATTTKQGLDEPPKFLFVQHAGSGSLVRDGDLHRLILKDISDSTLRFADRPYRYVDVLATGAFVDQWTLGDDSFQDDPPNAALIMTESDTSQKSVIVELINPVYDEKERTLVYDVIAVADSSKGFTMLDQSGAVEQGDIAGQFGQATLVIDDSTEVFPVSHGLCRWLGPNEFECDCERGYIPNTTRPGCVENNLS